MSGKRFVVIDQDSLKQALAEADAGDAVTVVEGAFEKPPKLKVVHGKWVVELGDFAQPGWDLCYPAPRDGTWEPGAETVRLRQSADLESQTRVLDELRHAFAAATALAREFGLDVEELEAKQRRAEDVAEFCSLYRLAAAGDVVALRALPKATEELLPAALAKILDGLISFNEDKSEPHEPLSFDPTPIDPDFYTW
jgi:hypothetical protein